MRRRDARVPHAAPVLAVLAAAPTSGAHGIPVTRGVGRRALRLPVRRHPRVVLRVGARRLRAAAGGLEKLPARGICGRSVRDVRLRLPGGLLCGDWCCGCVRG